MTKDGLLLLSHCGFSFMDDLIAALDARGLRSFVLSSSPLLDHRAERINQLSRMATRCMVTNSSVLTREDVFTALFTLHEQGERVIGCITVWEAYRELMAEANAELGLPDLSTRQVSLLRDKLRLRNRLADAGLSQARAVELTRGRFEALKADGRQYFVKPSCGIASYGAFTLRPDSDWRTLEQISSEAHNDEVYRSAFGAGLVFIAEDYICGGEYSFELFIVNGRVHLVALHEKCKVTETSGTVLEDCCTSPPVSIDSQTCCAGIAWVGRVIKNLDLRWGCFHLEARHDGTHWDLIEINPRVGGCLISPSVKALNGVASVLELWLDLLIAAANEDPQALADFDCRIASLSYTSEGIHPGEHATFFRAYFARTGKIDFIGLRPVEPPPVVSQLFLKTGDEITQSSREVFLGQLLWCYRRDQQKGELANLMRMSEEAIEVRYTERCPSAKNPNEVVENLL